jgi:hypothetical protein
MVPSDGAGTIALITGGANGIGAAGRPSEPFTFRNVPGPR